MYHIVLEADITSLPLDAPSVRVNRHFIKDGQQDTFQMQLEEVKTLLQNYSKPWPVAGGWRVEESRKGMRRWGLFSKRDDLQTDQSLVSIWIALMNL